MEYDQLLERVKDNSTTLAVVKLHKPNYTNGCGDSSCCGPDYCACGDTLPCPTIEAIEEELE